MSKLLVIACASLAVVAGSGTAAARADSRPTASELESQLVCPTCRTTLDQSDAPAARRIKLFIRRRLAEGASAAQIKRELVAQFGEGVLATPRTHGFDLLAWLLPLGGIALGAVVVGALAWAWSRRGAAPPEQPLDAELERRVDEELARFEG
jgi:cytochrome c-type biogenesis protein CcmH